MTDVERQIHEAYRRVVRRDPGGARRFVQVADPGVLEQLRHGTTDYALAAWYQLRSRARATTVRSVAGVTDYLVPDLDGSRTVETPALRVVTAGGWELYLTGCSWGYGGEGCRGTALVLADLGWFPTVEVAARFVANVAGMTSEWGPLAGPPAAGGPPRQRHRP